MAVKFISHVDQNGAGEWFIKLTDTLEEKTIICNDLDEYEKQIEELGAEYGGEIEVVWTRSNLLTPANYQDLQEKMAQLQEKYKEEIEKINGNNDMNESQSGFNPND
ncbi:MAG: hypothetical protein U9R16_06235 [Campylobacterota bacterium]|nr:hypothetical protein [Campylobacterota bacterium]